MKLERGSYGDVYQLFHEQENTAYAVKILSKSRMKENGIDEKNLELEITVLGQFQNRHLLKLKEKAEDDKNYYLVTDFCNRGTIHEFINQNKRTGIKKNEYYEHTLTKFSQILIGYHDLFKAGYMHRDINIDNILIKDDTYIIGDFGLVTNEKKAVSKVGTPLYSAPEIFGTDWDFEYDYKVDIFSLGVLLYYMLFKTLPWKKNTKQAGQETDKKGNPTDSMDYKELDEIMSNTSGMNLCIPPFPFVPNPVINLLQRMITYLPNERMTFEEVICHEVWNEATQPTINLNLSTQGAQKKIFTAENNSDDKKVKEHFRRIREEYLGKIKMHDDRDQIEEQEGMHQDMTSFGRESCDPSNDDSNAMIRLRVALDSEKSYNEFLLENIEPHINNAISLEVAENSPMRKFFKFLPYLRLLMLRKFELYNKQRADAFSEKRNFYNINSFEKFTTSSEVSEATDRFTEHQLAWAKLLQTELSTQMMRYQLHLKNTRPGNYLTQIFELAQDKSATLIKIEDKIEEFTLNLMPYFSIKVRDFENYGDEVILRALRVIFCISFKEFEKCWCRWTNLFSYNNFTDELSSTEKLKDFVKRNKFL